MVVEAERCYIQDNHPAVPGKHDLDSSIVVAANSAPVLCPEYTASSVDYVSGRQLRGHVVLAAVGEELRCAVEARRDLAVALLESTAITNAVSAT